MSIDIRHIAKLSCLKIKDDKLIEFEKDMESIIAMVDGLPDIEEKLMSDSANVMKLREDAVVPSEFTRDELIANAPEVQNGCLAVPKTVV